MREYKLEAKNIKNPIYRAPIDMEGTSPSGNHIYFSNYYMVQNEKPYFAICGEAHFSRMDEAMWEDEVIKMKMGGLNIIATYVFWIHHEEIEGEFDWSGNKNLRKFVKICNKHDMQVILRVGPFDHGECRNGGFPDWIYGRPFDIRSNSEGYLFYTRRLFRAIGEQVKGLMFKDGGPIIGTQIENEYEHASAPWEMTTENSKEWIVSGSQGAAHMQKLKDIAIEEGLDTPFYTATAWGGSCAPVEVTFPLWGGYAFRPWMFYGDIEEHPATAEYLMNDFHNNASPQYYNFDPEYPKEDFPFACCEMGGGMTVFYQYRFQLPYESVGAMAAVKVASGCNFLGYYMYHGGTNPHGKKTPFLNENAVPKFSYDYQAAVGEFGQIRDSFKFLKLQHLLYKNFEELMCNTKTVLPPEAALQQPEETDTLRYAIRVNEEGRGFLFINNYQDHAEVHDQKDFALTLSLDTGTVRVPEVGTLNLSANANAILPIQLELDGILLRYATTQLITKITNQKGEIYYFFFAIPGMRSEYSIDKQFITAVHGGCAQTDTTVEVFSDVHSEIICKNHENKVIHLCTLPISDAMNFWQFKIGGVDRIMITNATVLPQETGIRLECRDQEEEVIVKVFPPATVSAVCKEVETKGKEGVFDVYELSVQVPQVALSVEDKSTVNDENAGELKRPVVGSPITSTKVVNARAEIHIAPESFDNVKQLILQVDYIGDIGYAFIDGKMIHDNFCNGATWEIDLMPYKDEIIAKGLYLYISPYKEGAKVHSESAMAARYESADKQIAEIHEVQAVGVYDIPITIA
ncbi:MAG: beta-galactosidase [Anaerolineaceae bacterium]|nr:MAG: beta-galactosidase [Anaerolineaceae bacterium]